MVEIYSRNLILIKKFNFSSIVYKDSLRYRIDSDVNKILLHCTTNLNLALFCL